MNLERELTAGADRLGWMAPEMIAHWSRLPFTPALAQHALNAPGYHAYLAEVFTEERARVCRAGLEYIAREEA